MRLHDESNRNSVMQSRAPLTRVRRLVRGAIWGDSSTGCLCHHLLLAQVPVPDVPCLASADRRWCVVVQRAAIDPDRAEGVEIHHRYVGQNGGVNGMERRLAHVAVYCRLLEGLCL